MLHLKRNLFIDASIVIGSLVATFVTQGNTMVTSAALVASTMALEKYKEDKDKEDSVKQLPSFFFWDLTHENRNHI